MIRQALCLLMVTWRSSQRFHAAKASFGPKATFSTSVGLEECKGEVLCLLATAFQLRRRAQLNWCRVQSSYFTYRSVVVKNIFIIVIVGDFFLSSWGLVIWFDTCQGTGSCTHHSTLTAFSCLFALVFIFPGHLAFCILHIFFCAVGLGGDINMVVFPCDIATLQAPTLLFVHCRLTWIKNISISLSLSLFNHQFNLTWMFCSCSPASTLITLRAARMATHLHAQILYGLKYTPQLQQKPMGVPAQTQHIHTRLVRWHKRRHWF